jgi:hypothetical protein
MKNFKMKAWLKKENKMVNIIGIDFSYEYIKYTEDNNLMKIIKLLNLKMLNFCNI